MVNQATALLIEMGKVLNRDDGAIAAPSGEIRLGDRRERADAAHEPDDTRQLNLEIQLGHARLTPDDVPTLRKGTVVVLDEALGEAVTLVADSRPIGRGEIVVVDGKIGVRIVELADPR
jgi:flagellar motor switch protein FliN